MHLYNMFFLLHIKTTHNSWTLNLDLIFFLLKVLFCCLSSSLESKIYGCLSVFFLIFIGFDLYKKRPIVPNFELRYKLKFYVLKILVFFLFLTGLPKTILIYHRLRHVKMRNIGIKKKKKMLIRVLHRNE